MKLSTKLAAGDALPALTIPRLGGGDICPATGGQWQLFVVYRGKHCPLCKTYLKTLDGLIEEFAEIGVSIAVASGDPVQKAAADVQEHGWRFPVGYGMSVDQMKALGLYISDPRPQETDRPFAEPGLFLINPQGQLQIIDISNAPFARPDLNGILRGVKLIQERQYPIRGTLA